MIEAFEKAGRPFGCYISSTGGHGATGSTTRLFGENGTVGPCIDDWFDNCWRFLCNQLGMDQLPQDMLPMMRAMMAGNSGEAGAPARPSFAPPIVPPEGSVPVTPADMPLGQFNAIHMPFNASYFDKDFTTYK